MTSTPAQLKELGEWLEFYKEGIATREDIARWISLQPNGLQLLKDYKMLITSDFRNRLTPSKD